jgi:hypothetical protein
VTVASTALRILTQDSIGMATDRSCRYYQIWFAVSYKYFAKIASIFAAA